MIGQSIVNRVELLKMTLAATTRRYPLFCRASHAGEKEVDMFKRKASEKHTSSDAIPSTDNGAAAQVIEAADRITRPPRLVDEQTPPNPEPIIKKAGPDSCIGSGMSIVGKIDCNGPAQVFGRVEGELRASDLVIGDGAEIEGNIVA